MMHDVVEVERRIAAPPDIVFAYFTDPERFRMWLGVDAEVDPQPGGAFRVTVTGESRMVVSGAYVEVDPPTRVTFTWGWEETEPLNDAQLAVPPGTSTVEVELIPEGDATLLRLRHTGLPAPAHRFHLWGWDVTLDRLTAEASGRDAGPNPFVHL